MKRGFVGMSAAVTVRARQPLCYAPKVAAGVTGLAAEGDEGYAANVDANGVKIRANALAGVKWASYTLRQLAIAKRGTMKTEGMILPTLSITDSPHLAFRVAELSASRRGGHCNPL